MLEAALKTINSKIEDKHALIKALREDKVEDTARGPVRFDKYGNVVGNVYIRRVEKKGGATSMPWSRPIRTSASSGPTILTNS